MGTPEHDLRNYDRELSAYQQREDDIKRACVDAIPDMWVMSLEDMDLRLRGAMSGRFDKAHVAKIQAMLDALDDIATTAPSYLI